jgi:hypothetical protein
VACVGHLLARSLDSLQKRRVRCLFTVAGMRAARGMRAGACAERELGKGALHSVVRVMAFLF